MNLTRLALEVVALGPLGRPVPIGAVRSIRRLARGTDPFQQPGGSPQSASQLRHPRLRELLAGQELGTWALGVGTLNWLEHRLVELRPSLVLEFGSGISTVCLAQYLADLHGTDNVLRVVSIDQDEAYASQTRELLGRVGLGAGVRVLWAPISEQVIEGHTTTCYVMPQDLEQVFGGRKAEFVLIDGPAAAARMRFGTIPLARPFAADHAAFVLDDGLRDGEVWVAEQWSKLPGVEVKGIVPLDKGLAVGNLNTVRS